MKRSPRGLGVVEPFIAVGILVTMMVPALDLVTRSASFASASGHRTVVELRVRRLLAEVATTPFRHAASTAGKAMPIMLKDPPAGEAYQALVSRCSTETRFELVSPTLARVHATVRWNESAARDTQRNVEGVQLKADLTSTLADRWALAPVEF